MTYPLYSVLLLLCAYLLGSIPSAVWIGKAVHGVDVRQYGSGNAGTTNVLRVLGWKTAVPVLIIDLLKGFLSVTLIKVLGLNHASHEFINLSVIAGICAVFGHIFPVFAQFKGGKGVATLAGIVIAIQPWTTLIAMLVFVLVLVCSRYVSLSSISAGLAFPLCEVFIFRTGDMTLLIFSLAIFVALLITHHKNIERLFSGKEHKIKIKSGSQIHIDADLSSNEDKIF